MNSVLVPEFTYIPPYIGTFEKLHEVMRWTGVKGEAVAVLLFIVQLYRLLRTSTSTTTIVLLLLLLLLVVY